LTSFPRRRWRCGRTLALPLRADRQGNRRRGSQSLGWYAMLLLVMAALVESLLASRYLGGEPGLTQGPVTQTKEAVQETLVK